MTTAAPEAPPNGTAAPLELNFRKPGAAPTTLNILLYGPPGTGKSTAAAKAPGPIVVLTTQGENAWRTPRAKSGKNPDDIRELPMTCIADLDNLFRYLRAGQGGEKTVVIDTIGDVLNIVLDEYAGGPGQKPHKGTWGDALTKVERFIGSMRDLSINVVVIAHEQIDDSGDEPVRRPYTGGQKLPEQVMSHVDVVAYTAVVPATDETPKRFVGQIVDAAGRRAKDRTDTLGDGVRDLDLAEWIDTAAKGWGQIPSPAKNGGKD